MNASTGVSNFFAGTVIYVLLWASGCDRHVDSFVQAELESVRRGLEAFRASSGDSPSSGKLRDCKRFLSESTAGRRLVATITEERLLLEDLDSSECVLLFASGVGSKLVRAENVHSETTRFEATSRYVVDRDGDGWPEYRLPGFGVVTLQDDRFEVTREHRN